MGRGTRQCVRSTRLREPHVSQSAWTNPNGVGHHLVPLPVLSTVTSTESAHTLHQPSGLAFRKMSCVDHVNAETRYRSESITQNYYVKIAHSVLVL